jgi:hypothetical protein
MLGMLISTVSAQDTRVKFPTEVEAVDRVAFPIPLNKGHPLCWANFNPETNLLIRLYRYRVEGGPRQLYITLPYDLWIDQVVGTAGVNFCTAGTHKVPKAGHWVYEAQICFTPVASDDSNCSTPVVSAACASGTDGCAGVVGSVPRGWWIYGYLPPPSGVGF